MFLAVTQLHTKCLAITIEFIKLIKEQHKDTERHFRIKNKV